MSLSFSVICLRSKLLVVASFQSFLANKLQSSFQSCLTASQIRLFIATLVDSGSGRLSSRMADNGSMSSDSDEDGGVSLLEAVDISKLEICPPKPILGKSNGYHAPSFCRSLWHRRWDEYVEVLLAASSLRDVSIISHRLLYNTIFSLSYSTQQIVHPKSTVDESSLQRRYHDYRTHIESRVARSSAYK